MTRQTTPESSSVQNTQKMNFAWSKIGILVSGAFLILLSVAFFLGGHNPERGFVTFQEIKLYATKFEEHPKMDNDNIIKPDYTSFFASWKKGFLSRMAERILYGLHLKKRPSWSPEFFKKLILRVTKMRMDAGFKSDVILKMAASEKTQIVVVGNLQAAFHSLVNNLGELIKLGILDEKLRVCKSDHVLIFLGNAINRAPYSMETMSVIARLIEENPKTVFYMRGNHEDNNYWRDYTLKQELMSKAAGLSDEAIPLDTEVNAFFATLPLALYVGVPPEPQQKYVRFSHEGKDSPDLDETKIAGFLRAPLKLKEPDIVEVFNIKESKEPSTGEPVQLAALIRSEKKRKTFQTMDGLRLLTPEEGTVAWTILSCPTKVYQLGIKFFYDAFGIVSSGKRIEDWTITLHNQDVRIRQGYATRTCNILSGSCDKKDLTSGTDSAPETPPSKDSDAKPVVDKLPKESQESSGVASVQPDKKTTKTAQEENKKGEKPIEKQITEKAPSQEQKKSAAESVKKQEDQEKSTPTTDPAALELTPAEPEAAAVKTPRPAQKSVPKAELVKETKPAPAQVTVPLPEDLASERPQEKKVELLERKKELEEDLVSVIQEIELTTQQHH